MTSNNSDNICYTYKLTFNSCTYLCYSNLLHKIFKWFYMICLDI
uniref:Uncharacterized protein n=1 Tax=Lepeophtheirus salmonis TaxID=72036 RepID=A0A0K2TSM6_LEPSM